MHQRNQRRQQVSALLEAEGLSYQLYQYRVPGLYDYVFTGTGDAGELVAQAKLISQQAAAPAPGAAAPGGFAQGGYVV